MAVDVASLRIVKYPSDVLKRKAGPIGEITDEVRAVAERMIELMHEAEGIGLAAPQVGLAWRLFVAFVQPTDDRSAGDDPPTAMDGPRVYINPVLTEYSRDLVAYDEGCLSLPGIVGEVRRPSEATVTALDLDGHEFTERGADLVARCWQHETDHLDGVLILDRMTQLSRMKNRAAVRELEQESADRVNVVFLGSGAFGLPTLERLAAGHRVVGVVSQPDRPAGRKRRLTPTPVAQWASERQPGNPLLRPEDVNESSVVGQIRGLDAEAWVVIAFGQKLSAGLIADRFVINLHASLLPRWRGAAPINRAILGGDARTGNSVITIADRMDAGLLLGQDSVEIGASETAGDLHDRLAQRGPGLIESVLESHASGTLAAQEQDETLVTRARKLKKADGVVDLSASAAECVRRVNGLSPWPGVAVGFREEPLKLVRAKPGDSGAEQGGVGDAAPGAIVDAGAGSIACGSGAMCLLEVQPPGKRVMSWQEFARGQRVESGERLMGVDSC